MNTISLLGGVLLGFLSTQLQANNKISIENQSIETDRRLIAISLRTESDMWVSGAGGAVYRSLDKGESWIEIRPPAGAENMEFRDVAALSEDVVLLMSAGEGESSNIFRSSDNGKTWVHVLKGNDSATFFDCMAFSDENNGWLYGDSIDNKLYLQQTSDGGKNWQNITLPFAALKSEGGFASSGTCVDNQRASPLLVGTGNADVARLLVKTTEWEAISSPLSAGSAAGIFSIQRSGQHVFAAGGSLKTLEIPAEVYSLNLATKVWTSLGDPLLKGAIYGSALTSDSLFVSNPQGISMYSLNKKLWKNIDSSDVWAMACDTNKYCWGVGSGGNVRRIQTF